MANNVYIERAYTEQDIWAGEILKLKVNFKPPDGIQSLLRMPATSFISKSVTYMVYKSQHILSQLRTWTATRPPATQAI